MPWRAPENFGGLNFRGLAIEADDRGEVDLEDFAPDVAAALATELTSHGFVVVEAPAPHERSENEPGADDPEATAAPEDEPGFDVAAVTRDAIDNLNRNELFAYLKARGISARPPIKNEELRAMAREAAVDAI